MSHCQERARIIGAYTIGLGFRVFFDRGSHTLSMFKIHQPTTNHQSWEETLEANSNHRLACCGAFRVVSQRYFWTTVALELWRTNFTHRFVETTARKRLAGNSSTGSPSSFSFTTGIGEVIHSCARNRSKHAFRSELIVLTELASRALSQLLGCRYSDLTQMLTFQHTHTTLPWCSSCRGAILIECCCVTVTFTQALCHDMVCRCAKNKEVVW